MSRKKTVKLNLPIVDKLIKSTFRSNVVFCERMGRPQQKTWVTDWHRKDKDGNLAPKGFPSPEEAVLMCAILHTTPEEILLDPDDIALVNDLIEKEKAEQGKKEVAPEGDLDDIRKEAWEYIQRLDNEQLRKFIAAVKALLGE